MHISNKYSEKLGKIYFVKFVGLLTTGYLKWKPTNVICWKFDKEVVCSIKNKKSSHGSNGGKSVFQTIAIELYKQPKQTNKKRTSNIINKLY